jgi:hypothetical protein
MVHQGVGGITIKPSTPGHHGGTTRSRGTYQRPPYMSREKRQLPKMQNDSAREALPPKE